MSARPAAEIAGDSREATAAGRAAPIRALLSLSDVHLASLGTLVFLLAFRRAILIGLNMWATTVNRDGIVCAVAFSGADRGEQWPGSRVISAQKANTANAFSLPKLALSTANLYTAVQPGGTLYGLQHSNPVDTDVAYAGPSQNYGQANDPMVGRKIGGVNIFGGGLALYNKDGTLVGALGVSGDTSCTDHIVAWKVRHALNLDNVPAGVSTSGDDNIVFDITEDAHGHPVSAKGWGHPECDSAAAGIAEKLPTDYPIGPNP